MAQLWSLRQRMMRLHVRRDERVDFIGVTDEVDGTSMHAYEKARLRATACTGDPKFPEGNPDALPYLAWSHDKACASSMDAEVC